MNESFNKLFLVRQTLDKITMLAFFPFHESMISSRAATLCPLVYTSC